MAQPVASDDAMATADPAKIDRIEYTWQWAEYLEDLTRYSIEQNLFSQDRTRGDLPTILRYIGQARTSLETGDVARARQLLGQGEGLLADVRLKAGKAWTQARRLPFLLMAYHVLVVFAVLNVATRWGVFGRLATEFWGIPITVLGFGALGASLRTLYWLYRKAQAQTFRPQFTLPYLAAPFIGGLFALLVHLLFVGGLIAFANDAGGAANIKDSVLVALSGLAGFSWEWALTRLRDYIDKPSPSGTSSESEASAPSREPRLEARTDPPAPPARPGTAADRAKATVAAGGSPPASGSGSPKAGREAVRNIPSPPDKPGGL